jgi:tetratricopeptide (TPR) repeat protein
LGGGLGALGLGGGLGALGGGLGALGLGGGLGGGLGALGLGGGLGGGLGALGAGIGLGGGLGAGGAGGLGALGLGGGGINLGVGGGALGFGGGALGQLGNLGGQFGFQGGDQSNILIMLVRQVIAPTEWQTPFTFIMNTIPRNPQEDEGERKVDPAGNQVGFFPPAMALVVRGTSRINPSATSRPVVANPDRPPVSMDNKEREGHLVIRPTKDRGPDDAENRVRQGDAALAKKDAKPDNQVPLTQLDPKVIWQDALAKGADNPGLIIAVADFLATHGKFDHAAEFLKAELRQGIVVRPWVYSALAVALKEIKAPPEEIERAELAAADLQPLDAQGYLKASAAMADLQRYDHAVAFCQRAAVLQPNYAQPYEDALNFADLAKDVEGTRWASEALLVHDWPVGNKELHDKAQRKVEALAKTLAAGKQAKEAQQLLEVLQKARKRDLVIELRWQGQADLDLKVKEPAGSVCSFLNRQTVGGGTLIGDNLVENGLETYVAAQAFSGEYEIKVDRIWGRPLSGKAQLTLISHQGTPEEHRQLTTLDLSKSDTLRFHLESGSRTELAQVPPPETPRQKLNEKTKEEHTAQVLTKLRDMSEPEWVRNAEGMRGFGSPFASTDNKPFVPPSERSPAERVAYENRLPAFVKNSVDMAAQAAISPDRRYVRLSLSPNFSNVSKTAVTPVIVNPLLPGGDSPTNP